MALWDLLELFIQLCPQAALWAPQGLGHQQLQTTKTQPRHSLLHQHKDLSSLLDAEMLALPQRRGLRTALRLSQATRHSLQCPENVSTVTELLWGPQEEQARKEAYSGTAFKQEDYCRTSPGGFALRNRSEIGTRPLELPLPRGKEHTQILERLTPFPSRKKLWIF